VDAYWGAVIWALLPTVVVSVIFFFVIRSIVRMDRTERKTYARMLARERARRGLPPVETPASER
jgi:large-conductance mechanosensitive channel